ncbi:MAG: sulfatase [Acidobacteriota bacterium]
MRCRSIFVLIALAFGLGACDRSSGPVSDAPFDGPNLVIVLSDALRAANLPTYGYPRPTAPRLTELADQSVVFEHHFANYPGTPYSVSQMMSGRLMSPLLMASGASIPPYQRIEPDLLILPKVLREAGFTTGIVSSHPWFDDRARVLDHFDLQAILDSGDGHPYAPIEALIPPAEAFLEDRARDRQRFFLYVHSMDTHLPYRAHPGMPVFPEWGPHFAGYDHQIVYTDHWTGRLLDRLDALGLADDTIVLFTSDHGEELFEEGKEWHHEGHGPTLRRPQVHIPAILKVPGVEPRRWSETSRHIDIAPTLVGLLLGDDEGAGALLEPFRIDGVDFSAALRTAAPAIDGLKSLAHTWRYWSLSTRTHDLIYDQWHDRVNSYRIEPDERNVPRQMVTETEASSDAELRDRIARRLRERVRLPAIDQPGGMVGVPTRVVHEKDGAIPTYATAFDDDRWFLKTWMLLEVGPREQPGPLFLESPWSRGRYRVSVRLHPDGIAQGFRNRFQFQVLGGGNDVVQVDGERADERGYLDLGEHDVGPLFRIRIEQPEGGVMVSGFVLQTVGAEAPAMLDPEEEERLRALGYLE